MSSRHDTAHEITAHMRLPGQPTVQEAADVAARLGRSTGSGRPIELAAEGTVTLPFRTASVCR